MKWDKERFWCFQDQYFLYWRFYTATFCDQWHGHVIQQSTVSTCVHTTTFWLVGLPFLLIV